MESKLHKIIRQIYHAMHERVSKDHHYSNVTICDEWNDYIPFFEWAKVHYIKGYQLDKDLRGDGTHYSPESCIFIPAEVNLSFRKFANQTGYKGVRLLANEKYKAVVRYKWGTFNGKVRDTAEHAYSDYLQSRSQQMLTYISKHQDYDELIILLQNEYVRCIDEAELIRKKYN